MMMTRSYTSLSDTFSMVKPRMGKSVFNLYKISTIISVTISGLALLMKIPFLPVALSAIFRIAPTSAFACLKRITLING